MEHLGKATNWVISYLPPKKISSSTVLEQTNVFRTISAMLTGCDRALVRMAGVSGAIAVIMGAYGAHVFRQKEGAEDLKLAFETGSRYHLIHSAVLLAAPLTRKPKLVGGLLIGGMVLFSGSCYMYAMSNNQFIRKVTPFGGMLLIAAWCSMAL